MEVESELLLLVLKSWEPTSLVSAVLAFSCSPVCQKPMYISVCTSHACHYGETGAGPWAGEQRRGDPATAAAVVPVNGMHKDRKQMLAGTFFLNYE